MRRFFSATNVVLALLCVMYFITYVDRVNVSTAASTIQKEFGLNNTQSSLVFSAFAYPYLLFQISGGWVGDKFGARRTLFWCGLTWALATVLTGLAGGFASLIAARVLLGIGEGATFPTATRAMQYWVPSTNRGFAQGLTHAFSRFGNTVTPPLVAALTVSFSWRGSFVILGFASLVWVFVWFWYFRDEPRTHPSITAEELATLPQRVSAEPPVVPWTALIARMWPVTLTYFCYGWCLWLFLSWLPQFFEKNFHLDLKNSAIFAAGVFLAGVLGDSLGGVLSDRVLRRTGNVRLARLSVTVFGFLGAFVSLLPILWTHDLNIVALSLSACFFFAELTIGPMWAIPMDIAPKYSGTAAGMMNSGSALAAIASPLVGGLLIDWTGNWYLSFIVLMAMLLVGAGSAFLMHPERPFKDA